MGVLPYRARRFFRHNLSWNNVRFQWAIVGLLIWIVTNPLQLFINTSWIGAIEPLIIGSMMIVGSLVALQFGFAAYNLPFPTDYPWAVRKYDDLQCWWEKISHPARIGTFEGKSVLERWVFNDFRYVYDHTGRLIATEQTIGWSSTDPDWRIGDPEDIEIIVTRVESNERLPWLARLRSPKLPADIRAEVIDSNGNIAGYTTYKER